MQNGSLSSYLGRLKKNPDEILDVDRLKEGVDLDVTQVYENLKSQRRLRNPELLAMLRDYTGQIRLLLSKVVKIVRDFDDFSEENLVAQVEDSNVFEGYPEMVVNEIRTLLEIFLSEDDLFARIRNLNEIKKKYSDKPWELLHQIYPRHIGEEQFKGCVEAEWKKHYVVLKLSGADYKRFFEAIGPVDEEAFGIAVSGEVFISIISKDHPGLVLPDTGEPLCEEEGEKHEARHHYDAILFPEGLPTPLNLAKTEIIAYLSTKYNCALILQLLTMGGNAYDYYGSQAEGVHEDNLVEWRKHCRKIFLALRNIEQGDIRDADLLAITPMKHWGKLVPGDKRRVDRNFFLSAKHGKTFDPALNQEVENILNDESNSAVIEGLFGVSDQEELKVKCNNLFGSLNYEGDVIGVVSLTESLLVVFHDFNIALWNPNWKKNLE